MNSFSYWVACYFSFCTGLAVGVGVLVSILTIGSKIFGKARDDESDQ
jgi:hypothetical protein